MNNDFLFWYLMGSASMLLAELVADILTTLILKRKMRKEEEKKENGRICERCLQREKNE